MQRLKAGEAVEEDRAARPRRRPRGQGARRTKEASNYGIQRQGRRRRRGAARQVLPPGARRRDRRLRLARPRDHDPPRGLQERQGAEEGAGALRRRQLGRRQRGLLPGRARRSMPRTAPACSRTSRAPSPRPGSTSSRPAARPSTRWSRTASWSRSATPSSSSSASRGCATSSRVFDAYRITPTARDSGDDGERAGVTLRRQLGLLADVVAVDLDREGARAPSLRLGDRVDGAPR